MPVYDTFTAELLTPVSAYLRLAHDAKYAFLLESVEGGEKIARYTFVGANPEEVFRYVNGACVLESESRVVWGRPKSARIPAQPRRTLSSRARAGPAAVGGRRDRLFRVRHGAAGRAHPGHGAR